MMTSTDSSSNEKPLDKIIPVFIGFDSNEVVAYHVLCQSIIERATIPVSFTPIVLAHLRDVFKRERNSLQSTEFSFTRFLVPYLSNYQGWSIFMDCDMLMRADIAELWALRDDSKAVMVCKHDYQPKEDIKFLNQVQTKYEKKNWSSLMMFNNARCYRLTPEYVNSRSGLELHQFHWLENHDEIGSIPITWNYLVGIYDKDSNAKMVHYTEGGPYFNKYKNCDYAIDWFNAKERMNYNKT